MTSTTSKMTRRMLARRAACASAALAMPWFGSALAAPPLKTRPTLPVDPIDREITLSPSVLKKLKLPKIPFEAIAGGRGVRGPFGAVQIVRVDKQELPVVVDAHDGSARLDMTGRSVFVRYGTGASAIVVSTAGVKFGAGKPQAWSAGVVTRLVNELGADRDKARGAMLLRATLQTSYPVAAAREGAPVGKSMGASIRKSSRGFSRTSCTTKTVTDTVTRTVTETIAVVKTAEAQYQECYDREIGRSPCKDLGLVAGGCAAGICAARAFVDLVTGFVDVVTTIAEQVTREVVTCVAPKPGEWPNPFTVIGGLKGANGVPQPEASFGKKEIDQAKKLLEDFVGFLGPFADCMMKGDWSLLQAPTGLEIDGKVVIPYGVKVCIGASCAAALTLDDLLLPNLTAWGAALSALAALSTEFAALVAPLGIVAAPVVAAAVAALPPAVVGAAAVLLGFTILAMLYGTAISAQLSVHELAGSFDDGTVCIEHPTFALALLKIATFTLVPAELFPPIVTG